MHNLDGKKKSFSPSKGKAIRLPTILSIPTGWVNASSFSGAESGSEIQYLVYHFNGRTENDLLSPFRMELHFAK